MRATNLRVDQGQPMSGESDNSVTGPKDARHRELVVLLRVQFTASTTGELPFLRKPFSSEELLTITQKLLSSE
jgi:hypothetical protein